VHGDQEPSVRLEVHDGGDQRTWAFYPRSGAGASDEAALGMSLLDVLHVLRRGWGHMLIGALVLAGLGVVYVRQAEPIYDVGAQVLVLQRTVLANQGERAYGTALFLATQAEIISSPLVVASALESLPQLPEKSLGEADADPVEVITSLVSATPIKGTNVLSLMYVGPSAAEGKAIVVAVIESYRQFIREIDQSDHGKDLEVLASRETELRGQLEQLEAQYAAMQSDNATAGAGSDGASVHESLLVRLSSELVAARARRIKLETEGDAVDEHGGVSRDRQESLSREKLLEQLWRFEVKAVELRAQYGERHPAVTDADQEGAALRDALVKLEERERAALLGEVEMARRTENRLAQAYRREVNRASGIEGRRFEQLQLKAELDRLSETHQAALATLRSEELTEQGLAQGRSMIAIHVLKPPIAPLLPLWPRPVLVVGPCFVVGALLGFGVAWLGVALTSWRARVAEAADTAAADRSVGLPRNHSRRESA